MAPIFVGSENENSRVRSDRIGLALVPSDPGTASEGDIYYNSSNNLIKRTMVVHGVLFKVLALFH